MESLTLEDLAAINICKNKKHTNLKIRDYLYDNYLYNGYQMKEI